MGFSCWEWIVKNSICTLSICHISISCFEPTEWGVEPVRRETAVRPGRRILGSATSGVCVAQWAAGRTAAQYLLQSRPNIPPERKRMSGYRQVEKIHPNIRSLSDCKYISFSFGFVVISENSMLAIIFCCSAEMAARDEEDRRQKTIAN